MNEPQTSSPDETLGPVAEFNALRQEIVARIPLQHAVLIFQLTTTGGVFSLVLTNWSLESILFVLPATSYLLCSSYYEFDRVIRQLGTYITTELSSRVPGGFYWEEWVRKDNRNAQLARRSAKGKRAPGNGELSAKMEARYERRDRLRTLSPYLIAFPGPSAIAVAVLLFRLLHQPLFQSYWWALWTAWVVGIALTWATFQIAIRLAELPQNPPEGK